MSSEPRFEVFPEKRTELGLVASEDRAVLTGQFVWHFKDADARITFNGAESFARREDANRSIRGAVVDVLGVVFRGELRDDAAERLAGMDETPPIVDLDANGKEIPVG